MSNVPQIDASTGDDARANDSGADDLPSSGVYG